jgi:radical SAM protein with 4Fe4S-binding SPASM domain
MPSGDKYLSLTPHCFLKHLESPAIYDVESDELYELSEEAFAFLQRLPARVEDETNDQDFIDVCLKEGILCFTENPSFVFSSVQDPGIPSLRYLELNITDRCNLQCSHCYLAASRRGDMPRSLLTKVIEDFARMQGLRLLLTGGEPLLHEKFWDLNTKIREYPFRSVLLSNGTLITQEVAKKLTFHEVQVSLDGWGESHDRLRGKGNFLKAVRGIENLRSEGITVSVATMVHAFNLHDFERLEKFLEEIGVSEWSVDVPCVTGRMVEHPEVYLSPEKAAPYLKFGFGDGSHQSSGNYACGAHLCAVLPDGRVCKCTFFSEETAGMVQDEDLKICWGRIPHLNLKELRCDCDQLLECRGGCRYRASLFQDRYAKDPVQCFARGFIP